MTIQTEIPANPNPLRPNQFSLRINKCPEVNFNVVAARFPGLTMTRVEQHNPFSRIPWAGDDIIFDDLSLTIQVDEDLNDWVEMFNWVYGLGFPYAHSDYNALQDPTIPRGTGLKSDMSLFVLSSKFNPVLELTFIDAFPEKISGWEMDTRVATGQPPLVYCTVSFAYNRPEIKRAGSI